ncbi:MAG: sensor histidine kinase [Alphaproteobacteria bacterium]|nr:sensor histidine kinase [Alphaproteobacteria bacterium]
MRRAARSLAVRLALFTSLWVAVGLLLTWLHVTALVVRQIEGSFDARLDGLLDAVVAGAARDATGQPYLIRSVAEPRFNQPLSGAYWQIEGPGGRLATSRSLWDERLPPGPPGDGRVQNRDVIGPRGQRLRLVERDIVLPDAAGSLHVAVAIAHDATLAEISRLRGGLALSFAALGAGLVGFVVATVSFGLRPLRRLRQAVADLRAGRRTDLHLPAPGEVQPLVAEIDALVAQNRATVERARNHVGNLAHALRTRLAVLRNALDSPAGADLSLAQRELAAAEHLVQHHLARARASALTGAAGSNSDVAVVAEEIAQALRQLFAERGLSVTVSAKPGLSVACERQDLAEMLGNLMENACKWAGQRVVVTASREAPLVAITVADDGPGLAEAQLAAARMRGARLDEATPGSGLGLAIVADLAALYRGSLELQRSELGGLAARLTLPAA